MNYTLNSKHRKLRHRINVFLNRLSFNFLHLSFGARIVTIGILVTTIGLFFPWFLKDSIAYTAFQYRAGGVGYMIVPVLGVLLFLLLSHRNKEQIKSRMNIGFHDYTMMFFAGILIALLTIAIFNVINGYGGDTGQVELRQGGILTLIGAIFIGGGGILLWREERYEILRRIYVENQQPNTSALDEYRDILDRKPQSKDKNMTLPI